MNAVTRDARLGSTVGGKYLIASFLAEGGMGAVYAAQHIIIKRRFAVKFLHADLARRRDALARFRREAETAGALESENVAAVVDFGIATDGAPYIVMEYLEGCDLGRLLLLQGPLPVERAADLVVQACKGIQEAHAAGVIHRDLKPENLFVCRRSDGSDLVKIVDFGIAKLKTGDAGEVLTGTWDVVGTAAYMSPEQARGEADLDPRTDVYALGVILYKLLSGRTPHPGDSYNAVLHHISTEEAIPLACPDRELAPQLVAIVQRALARDPGARHASAQQLGAALLPWARRQEWPRVTNSPAGTAPTALSTPVRPARRVRRRSALYGGAGLVVLTAFTLVVIALGQRQSVREPEAIAPNRVAATAVPTPAPATPAPAALSPAILNSGPMPVPTRPKVSARDTGRPPPAAGRPHPSLLTERLPTEKLPSESTQAASQPESSGKARVTFDIRNPYD